MLAAMREARAEGPMSIRLPREHMQQKEGVHFFAVEVVDKSKAWRVLRRYNDFWYLKKQLGGLPGGRFPRRGFNESFFQRAFQRNLK